MNSMNDGTFQCYSSNEERQPAAQGLSTDHHQISCLIGWKQCNQESNWFTLMYLYDFGFCQKYIFF